MMEYATALFAVPLICLKEVADREGIPAHCLGVAIRESALFGDTLYGCDLSNKHCVNEMPTLQSFIEYAWLNFKEEPNDGIVVTFGRMSDDSGHKTVAYVGTRRDLERSMSHTILQTDISVM